MNGERCLTGAVSVQASRKSLASDSQRRNADQNQAGLGLVALNDLQSMAREEGEGMETTETESPSAALTPLPSLEQLLTSPDPKQGLLTVEAWFIHCKTLLNTSHTLDHIARNLSAS